MSEFALGQRWISDSESDLGLGTVVVVNQRRISMLFPATGEQREYVIGSAPLTRVIFNIGDKVESADGWSLAVTEVDQIDGLIVYTGTHEETGELTQLMETRINHHLKFNKPQDRLFTGQVDRNDWFSLRYESLQHQHKYQTHPLVGLAGARTSLIPHQLHIAKETAQRVAPRVLLSDEVGLGKTIEAGMILHQQLLTGRASRVLILLPEALQYQWLVEMLRRFNLKFAIFDEARCAEYKDTDENPFETEQLIICPLSLVSESEVRLKQAQSAQWDLVIVDEAHHLKWSEDAPSQDYLAVEALAKVCAGLLLLTATPDQLGHQSHFARLRLLDPERFYDYEKFVAEESEYQGIAEIAKKLSGNLDLSATDLTVLGSLEGTEQSLVLQANDTDEASRTAARQSLIKTLIDRHGTGRVLFRNTRASVKGFPKRCVLPVELEMPAEYQSSVEWWLSRHEDDLSEKAIKPLLTPEFLYQSAISNDIEWWKVDPRVEWLTELVKQNKHEKFLIICAHASTALALELAVRVKHGLSSAVFHEGMTIVERDRAAAWFADLEEGCQLLICSEIGSEGRNFQFSRNLVLFDIPLNPDLLEQRIGRLDRIGQKHDIQIHVPYFASSASETIFKWQHHGINAYADTCPGGIKVYEEQSSELLEILAKSSPQDVSLVPLISHAKTAIDELNQQMEQGRDILLELNSKGFDGEAIAQEVLEMDDDTSLVAYMFQVFDVYGVQQDDRGEQCLAINPTEHMLEPHFPELTDDGMTISFDRETALSREDVRFLSWDHPMVQGCFEMINSGEVGNCAVAVLPNKALPEGTYLVELIYVVETSAPKKIQPGRFLPPTPVRLLLDKAGNDLNSKVTFNGLNKQLKPVKRQVASQLATALQSEVHQLIEKSAEIAQAQRDTIVEQALQKVKQELGDELTRLEALSKVNPSIRTVELDVLKQQQVELLEHMNQARIKLDAIRLIVVSHS